MGSGPRYLIDTNVLLRLSRQKDPLHQLAQTAMVALESQGAELCFALQNIAELWNVSTRPTERNGFGLSIAEANASVEFIEHKMTFLPDNEQVYYIWRSLLVTHDIHGVQVHDARLAAIMEAYAITFILTLNQEDFRRFPHMTAIHPSQVQA